MEEVISEPSNILERYKTEIQLYDKAYKNWETKGNKIIKRYKDEHGESQTNSTRFNILYSNIQTLFPAAYSKHPKPDISRRFKDDDDLGRITADVLERCTTYYVDNKFSDVVKHALQDRLLVGRGVPWIRYEPKFENIDTFITNDEENETLQELSWEDIVYDYINWKDFGHNVARVWDEVYIGWKKVFLSKEELEERFGKEMADECPLDYSPRGLSDEKTNDSMKKATIYECWDKKAGKVYWLHKDLDKFLDEKDDPLELPEFFPFPKPLFGVITNDSLVPVPDFVEYQDQADELDELTTRISQITKSIKVVGVYDASAAGVERMLNEGVENRLIAVESWAVFGEKGGLKSAVEFLPMRDIAEVLLRLYEAREKVKADLYEITGISDIIRGATKASETATAQNIKSQFATLRLDTLQHSVARMSRDMVVSTALIIAKHFSLDTIKAISGITLMTAQEKQQFQMQQQQAQMMGQQPPEIDTKTQELLESPTWEEVYALLQDQPHLNFRVDIETDSTIKINEQEEQQARMQFLQAAGGFLQQASANPNPDLMPLLIQMLMFGIRGFKVGKSIEGTFKTILNKVEKESKNPQAKPDSEMEKMKGELQMEQQRMQAEQQESQLEMQIKEKEHEDDMRFELKKHEDDLLLQRYKIDKQAEADITIRREAMQRDYEDKKSTRESEQKHELNLATPPDIVEGFSQVAQGLVMLGQMMQQNSQLIVQLGDVIKSSHQEMITHASKPKNIVYDANENPIRIETMQ